MTDRLFNALIRSPGDWGIVLGLTTLTGAALGPPYSKLPRMKIDTGTAAAWGLTWGFFAGIILIIVLPKRFLG